MDSSPHRTLIPMFDVLRGERVIVRPYRPEDAASLQQAVEESREHIRPWLPFADEHQTVEASLDWINQQRAKWLLREEFGAGVWEAASLDRYLGGIGLHVRKWDTRYFEIGYWLRKSAEGHGYMVEAVRLLTSFAFDELKATRVEIRCDERNDRSANVARRLSYTHEARLRNHMLAPDGSLRNTLIFSRIPGDSPLPLT